MRILICRVTAVSPKVLTTAPQDTVRATASKPGCAPLFTSGFVFQGGIRGQRLGLPPARREQFNYIRRRWPKAAGGHERSTNIRHSAPDALNFATTSS